MRGRDHAFSSPLTRYSMYRRADAITSLIQSRSRPETDDEDQYTPPSMRYAVDQGAMLCMILCRRPWINVMQSVLGCDVQYIRLIVLIHLKHVKSTLRLTTLI
jgi:hypothetical protein